MDSASGLTKAKLRLALRKSQAGKTVEAAQILEEVAKFDPQGGYVWVEYARVLKELRRFDEAEVAFKRALRYAPKERKTHVLASLGLLYEQTRGYAAAVESYREAIAHMYAPVAWVHILYGNALFMLGDVAAAEEIFCLAASVDSEERVEAYENLALIYRSQKKYEDAMRHAEKALEICPDSEVAKSVATSLDGIERLP
ncbi:MAG: tetratricopeptide repeat protein [Pseudomonadota bacterium]